jgi:hypothetical protein
MASRKNWSLVLVVAGLILMLIGAIDPLEGAILILPGSGAIALGAFLGKSRHRKFLLAAFILVAVGVGMMWGVSAVGGFGGDTGRPLGWAVVLLPYPIGWLLGLVGATRRLIESCRKSITCRPEKH